MIGILTYALVSAEVDIAPDRIELFRTTISGETGKEKINELVARVQAETRQSHYLDKTNPLPVAIVAMPPQPSVTQMIEILWLIDSDIISAFRTAHQVTFRKTAVRITWTSAIRAHAERAFDRALRLASRQSSSRRRVSVLINGGVDIFDDLIHAARKIFADRLINRLHLASHHR